MNRRAALTWGTIVGALAGGVTAYDLVCNARRDDSTLSSVTRHFVNVTPGGRVIFPAVLVAAGIGFHEHIVKPLRHNL